MPPDDHSPGHHAATATVMMANVPARRGWGALAGRECQSALQTMPESFRAALLIEIADQKKLQDRCFRGAERFRLTAVWAGFVSAVAVALFGGEPWAKYLSAIAAVSALCLTIERIFGFRARSGWHCEYRIALLDLLLRLDDGASLEEVRRDRVALDGRMSSLFPQGSDPALPSR